MSRLQDKKLPPVHLWNPEYCGEIDMRLARDGTWYYMGSPIGRKRLVKLFASVLRLDDDGKFYLVTPVEKIGITVDDAPFVAVEADLHGEGDDQVVVFRTNVDDEVIVDKDHPIRVDVDLETGELIDGVWQRWKQHDPVVLADHYADALRSLDTYYIDCGKWDEHHLQLGARIYCRRLNELGIAHTYEEFEGGHMNTAHRYERSLKLFSDAWS